MDEIIITDYRSPIGDMLLGSFGNTLCLCDWAGEQRRAFTERRIYRSHGLRYRLGTSPILERTVRELDKYFAGERKTFDIPVTFIGTDFQKRIWESLLHIPYGATISYARLARQVGYPKGVRAVASAVGANSLSIIVPCHRVIGSDNHLTGYAGGLDAKRYLLELEARASGSVLPF